MTEHCVKIILKLSSQNGTDEELDGLFALENELSSVVEQQGVGEYDGNDIGQGEFTIYLYGADADKLFLAIQPVLQRSSLTRDGYILKRYGPPEVEGNAARINL